jgi:hypothetical protein
VLSPVTALSNPQFAISTQLRFEAPNRDTITRSRSPRRPRQRCSPRQRKPLVRSFGFPTAYQITNHLVLTHGRVRIPTFHQRSDERHLMGVIRTPWHVIKRTFFTVSEDQICRVSQIRMREGRSARAVHVFDRGEYQVCITARHSLARIRFWSLCLSSSSCLSGCSKPDLLFGRVAPNY